MSKPLTRKEARAFVEAVKRGEYATPPVAAAEGADTSAERLAAIRERYSWDKQWGVEDLLAALDERDAALKDEQWERRHWLEQLTERDAELTELRAELADLLAALAERDATILRLQAEHSAAAIAAHRDYSETQGRLQAECEGLRAETERARQERNRARLDARNEQSKAAHDAIMKFAAENDALRATIRELRAQIGAPLNPDSGRIPHD